MQPPVIKTDRLVIKALTCAEAEALFEYRSRPEISRFQTWKPSTLNEVQHFIDQYTQNFNGAETWFQMGIFLKPNLTLIGDLGVHFTDSAQVEIGFTIAKPYQHQGYGYEATQRLMQYLFQTLHKHRVIASVDPDNIASIALLQRIGMRQEAHFKKSLWFDGHWVDDLWYAILDEEYTSRNTITQ